MAETIKIVKDASEVEFSNFTLEGIPINRRSTLKDRAFQDGVVDTSDGKLKNNVLTLNGALYGASFVLQQLIIRTIAASWNDFKLYRSASGSYDYYYNIKKVLSMEENWIEGQDYDAANYELKLLVTDPYVYKHTATSDTITVDSSPKTDTVSNDANGAPVYPVITVTADTTISSLTVENLSDVPEGASDGLQFTYLDPNFVNTDELIIDCQNGTVEREGTNTIRYFSGNFIRLLTGNNSIKVTCQTSGATTVKFDFNERYY
jgi:hypothetical protein